MTIQTPEQIARSLVLQGDEEHILTDEALEILVTEDARDMIRLLERAVEADRMQRDGAAEAKTRFGIGTLVRLTGKDWDEFGIRGETVVLGVSSTNGRSENTFTHDHQDFVICADQWGDYSATEVRPTIGGGR